MSQTSPSRVGGPVAGVGMEELKASLLWPRLLVAARLAIRPARVGLATVVLVLIGLIGQLPRLWLRTAFDSDGGPLGVAGEMASIGVGHVESGVLHLQPALVGEGLLALFVRTPAALADSYPWSSLAILLPALLVWAVGGGAISRMAATEFSLGQPMGWTRGLGFAVARLDSLFACLAAPLVVTGLIVGGLAVVGWAMLSIPFVQVLGAALYFLALIAGTLGVLVLAGYVVGLPMLVPAMVCEGTDAIDAIQRCYAYTSARPLRLVLYLAVLLVEIVVVTLALALLARAVVGLTTWSTGLLLGERLHAAMTQQAVEGVGGVGATNAEDLSRSARATVRIIGFWVQVPMLLVASYVVSYWFSAGSVLYLLMRQVCDGQDLGELWVPGLVPGTHAVPGAGGSTAAGSTDLGEDDDEP